MLVKIGPRPSSSDDLVAQLLACHDRIRSFTALARAAAIPGSPARDVVDACSSVERYFTEALPLHVRDEEESLLPRLEGRSPEVDGALVVMKEQHERHDRLLNELLSALSALRSDPSDAARSGNVATAAVALERDFTEHLALEEDVVFPAVRVFLSPVEQDKIKEELRQRRTAK